MILTENKTIESDITACFHELVIQDTYQFFRFKELDTIIDIGTNVGVFSMLARCNHPQAKVIAIEPQKEVYEQLEPMAEAFQIHLWKRAFGKNKYLEPNRYYKTMVYDKPQTAKAYEVETCSLADIITNYKISKCERLFIKLDCEGAEENLLDDESFEVMSNAVGFGCEIHFSGRKAGFSHLPAFEVYQAYFDRLSKSHDIGYHGHSTNGHGIYTGVKKCYSV